MKKSALFQEVKKEFPPDPLDASGEAGEEKALALVKKALGPLPLGYRLYSSLRVPKVEEKGKYEIDLVVQTPIKILVIEVKNLSGTIKPKGDQEISQTYSSGKQRSYPDPEKLLIEKRAALRAFLTQNQIPSDPEFFEHLVVNVHDKATVPAHWTDLNSLFEIIRTMRKPRLHWWFARVWRARRFKQITKELDRLPTWDRVVLRGGKVIKGDVLDRESPLPKRQVWQQIHLYTQSTKILFYVLPNLMKLKKWRIGSRFQAAPLFYETVTIQPAGQREPREVLLAHVKEIHFGFKDQSYYDLSPRASKKMASKKS